MSKGNQRQTMGKRIAASSLVDSVGNRQMRQRDAPGKKRGNRRENEEIRGKQKLGRRMKEQLDNLETA